MNRFTNYTEGIIGIGIVQGFSVLIIISLTIATYVYSISIDIDRTVLVNFRHEEVRIACAESMLAHIVRADPLPTAFEKKVYGHTCKRESFYITSDEIQLETETNFGGIISTVRTIYSIQEKRIKSIKNI